MANARWSRLRNLFEQAREMTGEERSALLDRELGLLWGLTRRSRAKDAALPASGASKRPR